MLFILNKSHEVVGSLNSNGDLSKIVTYFDDTYVQDLGTGAETFTFSTMANNEQAQHLVAGNFVALKEDGEFKLFNIIQIEETHEDTFIKTVYCEMAGIELINEIIRPIKILNSSLRKFLTTILEGTEWQLGKIDAGFTQVFDFESTDYKSAYELIQEYAVRTYGAEISYRVEIEHGRIVGKYIDCYKERGNANGFRFAYGSNLTSVVRTVDMTNLATALIPVGNGGITIKDLDLADKPLGQDFITNEKAYEQWNINGSHIFGVHKADTDSPQELLRLARIALEERANPQIKYEMKAELLGKDVKIGDTVQVVDHEFNPPLYLSARVNQLTKSKTDPHNDEVVLANFKELNSNITNEMRQLASQLEGYVDSQFPIGGDKIQDGAIGKQQFSKQYHTEIVADAVHASLVETEDLIAGKADIGDLHAINASIENLQAENVDITGKLNATKAEIENLKSENVEITGSLHATNAKVENLFVDKANITDLNATNAKVDSLQADKASINQLNATKAEIKELVATKADIDSLTAISGKIDVLESSKANISDLNAMNATIGSLQANKADIVELNAVKGNITQLESEVAEIGSLKSDVAEIEHILAGNITADNIASNTITSEQIATGTITAGSGVIAEGAIGNAQISSIDAGKVTAGTVDTSKVTIQGADGHLRIKGNRLQVFQSTGNQAKERVSVGDVNGNGTVYGLRVRGADGQTILLDENGVKSEGITDGAITNDKISDDANIDGAKLNINSVVSKINEDGTETIQGTKIEVDGTRLNTKLSTITNKQNADGERITQAQSQITANTNAIKLKVDEQTYTADKKDMTGKLEKNTSEISTMKGQIALKVEQTDIENAKSEIEGVIDTKVDNAKAEIKVTTDAISQNVSNLSQTVSTKADGSTVTAINNKVGSLETSVSGITGRVSNVEKTTTTLGTQVTNAQSTADSAVTKADKAQTTANTNKNNITSLQGEVTTVKDNVASLEVTTSGISQKVSSVESTTASLTTQVGNAQSTATNALNKANSANTLADSKAKVFTTTPTTPYSVGDLWVQGASGDVMRCKVARSSGSYNASDWEKGSKYTDDTKANSVDNKVTNLQTDYNSTKSKVATLETNLDGITQRVSSTESTTTTLTAQVSTAQNTANKAVTDASNAQSTANTANSNATSAINKANTAQSTADSKAKVFTTTPTVPYKIGDLWVQGTTGEIMKCKTARTSGSYTASDWEKASKYTDDTKANAVDGKVTTLQGEYNSTKSKVATLETNLDGITQRVSSTESTTTTLTEKIDVTVKNVTVYYAINTSSTTAPTSGWSTTPPTWVEGKYIWSKTTTTLTNGTSTTTNPVCITGAKGATGATGAKGDKGDTGATGATGTGVESITTEYYLSTSKTTQTGDSWVTTQPTWTKGKYLWTRSKIVYKNPTSTAYTSPICDSSWDVVNDVQTQVDANKTQISTTSNKVSTIETNLSSITSRVNTVETTTKTLNDKVVSHESRLATAESKITDKAIINTVSSTIDQKVNTGIQGIQIGGRNLAQKTSSEFSAEHTNFSGITNVCPSLGKVLTDGLKVGDRVTVRLIYEYSNIVVETGQTAKCWIQGSGNVTAWNSGSFGGSSKLNLNGSGTHEFLYDFTINSNHLQNEYWSVNIRHDYVKSGSVKWKMFKVEKGTRATDWTPAPEDIDNQIANTETMLNGNIDSAVNGTKTEILNDVSKNYANKEIVTQLQETVDSKFEQTSKDITMQFNTAQNYTKEVDGKLQDYQNTVATHIRFSENGIDLGKSNSPFSATLDNTKLAFKQNNEEVAYISNNKMYITQAEIRETLRIGKQGNGFFAWVQGSEGNLSLKWSDS